MAAVNYWAGAGIHPDVGVSSNGQARGMTSELLSPPSTLTEPAAPDGFTGDLLDRDVADIMQPGCVIISDTATATDAARAIAAHRVDAVLVVDAGNGTPLGFVTAGGALRRLGPDDATVSARDAITEPPRVIAPHASARAAIYALSVGDTTRLLVRGRFDALPVSVVTKLDLAVADR
jgi:CBS domain-containing protein